MKTTQDNTLLSAKKPPSKADENGRNKCILIYEDDQEILFLCKILLARDNYHVETLTRCENVIADIARIKPDLILMDLWIPEIGGEKAVYLIKQNPAISHIPVLLFSANAKINEISKKIKADGFISKPFDINIFTKTIEQNL